MSVSFAYTGNNERSLQVEVFFTSPPDPSQPQAPQFNRMVDEIVRSAGVDTKKSALPQNGRRLVFTVTNDNAGKLANALEQINQYLEAEKGQEAAVRTLLTNSSGIEREHTQVPHHASKVAPTFELNTVRDQTTQEAVSVPVFGATIKTSAPALIQGLTGVASRNKAVKLDSDVTFDRVDIKNPPSFTGISVSAKGAALEEVMAVAAKPRDALAAEAAAAKDAPAKDAGKKPGDSWLDDLSDGMRSIPYPGR